MKHGWGIPWLAAAILPIFTGCAHHPPPSASVVASERVVHEADASGARLDPWASHFLKLAYRELARARDLMRDGNPNAAEWMLRRATADAELARALAFENVSRAEAQEETERLQTPIGPQTAAREEP